MTFEEFDILLAERFAKSKCVLTAKSAEYAKDNDKLHNFKLAAHVGRVTVPQAWFGMWLKHLISLIDMIESGEQPTAHWVDEKIGDLVNYLYLLEAIYEDSLHSRALDGGDTCKDYGEHPASH